MAELPPNVQAERRTDLGSRKIMEQLGRLRGQLDGQDSDLESIKKDLENHVTFKWLITIAGGFAVAVLGAAWGMQERALKAIEDNRVQREAAILQIRQETAATSVRIESKVDGLYKFFIEGIPKAAIRAEVKAEEQAAPSTTPPGAILPRGK